MAPTESLIDTIGSYLTIQIGQITLGPVETAILIATFAAALLSAFYLWRIGKQEERLDRLEQAARGDENRHRAQDVAEGHERASLEPIGKGSARQRHEKPWKAVAGGDGGDGHRVGVHQDGEQRHGSEQQPVARTGDC